MLKSYITSSELKIKTGPYSASLQALLSVRAIFLGRGAGMVTPSILPPPYKQLLRLPTPYFKMFLERFLNDTHPPLQASFTVTPTPAPIKNFNRTLRQSIDLEIVPFRFSPHSVVLSVQAGVFKVQSKLEFTVEGELAYWQDQFLIVHNSVQILYLKVLVQIGKSF